MTFRGFSLRRSWILLAFITVCVQGYDPHCTEFGKYCPTDLGNLSSNLIAYYTFSNPDRYKDLTGITGDLTDSGGATFQSDCAWNGAECVVFSGTQRLVSVGTINLVNAQATTGFTVCAWWFLTSTMSDKTIWNINDVFLKTSIGGTQVNFGTSTAQVTVRSSYPTNEWHHTCATMRAGTIQASYDGVLGSTSTSTTLPAITQPNIYIGGSTLGTQFITGRVDGFRVYNRALTAAEIMQVYQFRQYTCPPGTFQDIQENCSTRVEKDLIAYYSFCPENRLRDTTGITGSLTDSGSVTFQSDGPWTSSQTAVFSGSNRVSVNSVNFLALQNAAGVTVCFWLYTPSATPFAYPFYTPGMYTKFASASQFNGGLGGSEFAIVTNWVNMAWNHVCFVKTTSVVQVYVNNVLRLNSANANLPSSSTTLYIGSAVASGYITGQMDEFRIYKRQLSAEEVSQIYSTRPTTCSLSPVPGQICSGCFVNEPAGGVGSLIAYYPFCEGRRLQDATGITGSLTLAGSISYDANYVWQGSEGAVLAATTDYINFPAINFGRMSAANGFTMCMYFTVTTYSAWGSIFGAIGTTSNIQDSWGFSMNTATSIWWEMRVNSGSATLGSGIQPAGFGAGTIYHLCVTNQQLVWRFYWNGVLTSTVTGTSGQILRDMDLPFVNTANGLGMKVDEFRLYNRTLTDSEVGKVYNARPLSCTPPACPVPPVTSSCSPCPVGTFQPYPGQQSCLGCSGGHASFPGSVRCAGDGRKGPRPSATSSSTPGTIVYTVGPNYLTFNCPGGTFSSTVVQLSSTLTSNAFTSDNNVACAGTPCVWMSSQIQSTRRTATLIDGSISNDVNTVMAHTQCSVANPYFGIDFGTSQFVAGVLVLDRDESLGVVQRLNGFRIYIGNNLLPAGSTTTTPTAGGNGWSYPIADVTNTLCYTGRSDDAGYRSPVWASCGASGRYLYIVGTANNCLHLQEIIVLSSPPCTLCTPGKFSTYAQPNTVCAECPAGSYNTAAGMTFCQSCMAGYVQPEPGKTYCMMAAPPGSYNPPVASAFASELVAYYSFWNSGSLADGSGITGSIPYTGSLTITPNCPSPWFGCIWTNGTDYMLLPSMNLGVLANANGFTFCFWFWYQWYADSGNQYMFTFQRTDGTLHYLRMLRVSGSNTQYTIQGSSASWSTTITTTHMAWNHLCITQRTTAVAVYVNGASVATLTATSNMPDVLIEVMNIFRMNNGVLVNAQVFMDEIRFYNRALVAQEITAVYNFNSITPCPAGSFQDQPAQDTCKPCPIGTFQASTGQSVCTTCATATWTGTSKCDSSFSQLNRAVGSSLTQTPGMTQIFTNAAGFITFPCPSGTFGTRSTIISNLTIPSSSSASVYWADLGSSVYVDSIIVTDTTSLNQNQMTIYLGNTNYGTGVYPVSTSLNALCDLDRLAIRGYRNPAVYYCQNTGRYINIVAASGTLAISTVVATNQPICTLCSPGTFSFNTIPTVKCSQCPAGTYQTGSGKSSCDSCPTGTFQSGLGMTSATACVPINSNLIAHYTFSPGGRLRDSTGITGDLTLIGDMTYLISGPWPISHSAFMNSLGSFSMPGINFGSMLTANGFSICFWTSFIRNAALTWNAMFNCEATSSVDEIFISSVSGSGPTVSTFTASATGTISVSYLSQNVWTHVCVTALQNAWTLYLNAAVSGTMSRTLTNTVLSSCRIGGMVGTTHFTGSMDDFRIYNRAITQQEVTTLFNMKSGAPCNSTAYCSEGRYCPTELDSSCPNLIDYYTFPASNRVLDSTGTTGNLIPSGTITYISDCAWTGAQCANFDGTTAFYTFPTINIGALEAASGLAICLWFNPTSISGTPTIFQLGNGNANNNVILSIVSSKLRFTVYSGSTPSFIEFPLQVTANTWRHICIDGNAPNNWDLYDNGVPVLLAQTIDAPSTPLSTNTIGRDMTSSIYFSGRIDEFRIYNRNLTPQEIMDLYNYRDLPCPVGHFCPPGTAIPIPCPAGKYQASTGSSSCTNCPNGFYSTLTGSSSLSQCTSCS